MRTIVGMAAAILLCPLPGICVDWAACSLDLGHLLGVVEEAEAAVQDAQYAREEYESALEDLENCRNFPEIYDFLDDGCQSQLSDVEDAESEYEWVASEAEARFEDLRSVLGYVELSCEINLTGFYQPSASDHQRKCEIIKSYESKLSSETLRAFCLTRMSEEECDRCLKE